MPDLNLDKSVLSDVSPPYVQDTSVSVTQGYSNNAVPVDDFIMSWQQSNPSTPTQEQLNRTVKTLKTCLDANFGFITQCPRDVYRLDQVLKMIDLIESDAVSGFGTSQLREKSESEKIRDALEKRRETPVSEEELQNIFLENGKTGLGTLLIPFLYIRWGTTVLHNSFPSRNLDDNPGQVRDNVRSLRITYDTQTAGGESSGGTGSMMPGTSTCELTLNPQLVDGNGRDITVSTDGAELLVMWGYPNASLVRVHTFAQTSIRDSFYNEQTTTIGFRGIEWKTSRLSSQKRYNGGDWRKVVTDIAFEACATLGFEEKNCKVKFDPDDFGTGDSAFRIGETVQTGRGDIFAHLANVVEKSAACTVFKTNDREGKNDTNRGQYVISISCNPELRQDDGIDPRIVDRALWLGQVLAEKIELSDGGDNAAMHGNTGGKCGRNRPFRARVKNAVLKNFTDGCDYRLLKPSDIVNSLDATLPNEYLLELVKKETEGEDADFIRDVALLAPFNGKVKVDKTGCKSTEESADATCGPEDRKSTGNSVTITAEDPSNPLLEGFSWTFYYLASIQVTDGQQVTAGTQIGTQGMSGLPEVQVTGIRIQKEGATVTLAESQPLINDYIRTITYPCRLAESSCFLPGFATTASPGSGDPFHVHIQALDFQNLIVAFDNMAATDVETCYNLNQAGNVAASGDKKCWNASWERSLKEEVLTACVKAHANRRGSPCDFYIFDKENGSRSDRQSRLIANPFPQLEHIYSTDPTFAVGVRFFEEGTNPTPVFYSNGAGEELVAQLFHGDVGNLSATGLANDTIFGCDDDDGFEDSSGNSFLEDSEIASLTNENTRANFTNNWESTRDTTATRKVFIIAGHRYQQGGGTAGATNTSFVYRDEGFETTARNRTLEQIVVLRAMRFFQSYGASRGFTVEVDDAGTFGESFQRAIERGAEKEKDGFYAVELHCDAPINSRGNYGSGSGVIPPAAGRPISLYDTYLAREFGRYSQGHRGLAAGKFGVTQLELLSLDGQDFETTFVADLKSGDFTNSDRFLESLAYRFFSALSNAALDEESTDPSSAETVSCGNDGKYPSDATDRNLKILEDFCKYENCNPKDIAAFIMAECSWKINNVNKNNGCSGMFQCCPGDLSGNEGKGAPEKQMQSFLSTYTQPKWWPTDGSDFKDTATFFKRCTSLRTATFEQQLAAWLAYKSAYPEGTANHVGVGEGLCLNYTQIAIPNLVPVVRTNFNSNYKAACEVKNSREACQSFFNSNRTSWFAGKTYGTAEVKGICQYAVRNAVDDERLSGNCTFGNPLLVSRTSGGNPCNNSSSNRSLNARNTGTLSSGGLRDLKFRQEIKLNAQFGVCPRNVFLAPTSSDGLPQYILLPNMDNTDGFADFKIRSVSLDWNGSWRWSITAFRPAGNVTFQLPTTLAQPRSLNEWTNYYWFPNFQEDGNQFAPPGQRQSFNADGQALNVAGSGLEPRNGVDDDIRGLFDTLQSFINEKQEQPGSSFIQIVDEDAGVLNALASEILDKCGGQKPACVDLINKEKITFLSQPAEVAPPTGGPRNIDNWLNVVLLNTLTAGQVTSN